METTHKHTTANPQRPCCWLARGIEIKAEQKRREDRKAALAARTPEQVAADDAREAARISAQLSSAETIRNEWN